MRPPSPPHSLFLHTQRRQKQEERKDIFENVDKRLSVSPTRIPKGVIRELNSVHAGLLLSLHPQPFTSPGSSAAPLQRAHERLCTSLYHLVP